MSLNDSNLIATKQPMNDAMKKMLRSSGGPTAKQMQYVAAIARKLEISPGKIKTKLGAKRFINKWRPHYLEALEADREWYLSPVPYEHDDWGDRD